MGVAVLQMTSNVTQRYAVSPLLPGANVTIELVWFPYLLNNNHNNNVFS